MNNVTRLINAQSDQISKMNGRDLKMSIRKSEGRVIMAQHLLFSSYGLIRDLTNSELDKAFGADMILLNTFNFDDQSKNIGLQGNSVKEIKRKVGIPVGIYLGCPGKDFNQDDQLYEKNGMLASDKHIKMLKNEEIKPDFVVLGGNPGTGTSITDIIEATERVRQELGPDPLIFAGKWEDGVDEKVLGDPLASYDAEKVITDLINAGADVIDFPAPGSRSGISVEHIQKLIEFVHQSSPVTLAMSFLDSSLEGADEDTVRQIALKMKETGADIIAIGDGGFAGCPILEDIMQLSISIKGKPYTYFRMASR